MTKDDILKLAEELNGTRRSLDEVLEKKHRVELTDVDDDLLQLLDQTVKLCDVCGWWTDADLVNDDCICSECAPGSMEEQS